MAEDKHSMQALVLNSEHIKAFHSTSWNKIEMWVVHIKAVKTNIKIQVTK